MRQASDADCLRSDLGQLEQRLLAMGARAEIQLADAMRAIVTRESGLAQRVIEGDEAIDRDEVEIDQLAQTILESRRPVEGDLRFVTMSLKFVTDLERIGDLAANIARRAIELEKLPAPRLHASLPELSDRVQKNLRAALDSFVRRDAEAATGVIAADVEIDRLNAGLFCDLIAQVAIDYHLVTQVIPMTSVTRYLERIGDHVKNLAEEVVFMVRAVDIRHHRAKS